MSTGKTQKIILYHTYGSRYLYNQVLFSILTLYYHLGGNFGDTRVVVYTDRPKVFFRFRKVLPISIEFLSKDVIRKYKGDLNFVHRVKICVMAECFENYKSDILYLDSDTYFTESPVSLLQSISPGHSVMNSNDYDLLSADDLYENADWLAIKRVIKNFKYSIGDEEVKIPLTTRMWNAGVIGLSLQDSYLLEQIIDLSDQVYENKNVFTAEQFAFSYFLQNNTRLVSSGNVIFHYWRYFGAYKWRQKYAYHFRKFFTEYKGRPIPEQSRLAFELTLRHDELQIPETTIVKKIFKRLGMMMEVGLKGKIKNPV